MVAIEVPVRRDPLPYLGHVLAIDDEAAVRAEEPVEHELGLHAGRLPGLEERDLDELPRPWGHREYQYPARRQVVLPEVGAGQRLEGVWPLHADEMFGIYPGVWHTIAFAGRVAISRRDVTANEGGIRWT